MKVTIETTMTDYETFADAREKILKICQNIMDQKQPEYTNDKKFPDPCSKK